MLARDNALILYHDLGEYSILIGCQVIKELWWRSRLRQRTLQLQFWFAIVTHQGSWFRIPALPKSEFDWLI